MRSGGLGRLLVTTVLDEPHTAGYRRVPLDTLPSGREVTAMCHSVGLADSVAYCHNLQPAFYDCVAVEPVDGEPVSGPGT